MSDFSLLFQLRSACKSVEKLLKKYYTKHNNIVLKNDRIIFFQSASLLKDRCPNAILKLVFVHNNAYPGPEYGPFADMDNKKEKYLEHQSKVIGSFQL